MDCNCQRIPYRMTGAFSRIVSDYIEEQDTLKPFYDHRVERDGLRAAIENRKKHDVDRKLLVEELRKQYGGIESGATARSIELLLSPRTFTITTAHQPNILTGPLYFIYKIAHTIALSGKCKELFSEYDFVPVYYMGSEDADLDELGHLYIQETKYTWNTDQKGAVGRMRIDKDFLRIIDELENRLAVLPNGADIISLVRKCYIGGSRVQDATFHFVDELFKEQGLVVLIPDSPAYKSVAKDIFKDDLLHQKASEIVQGTIDKIDQAGYKVQANPREINLFYLQESSRERIVKNGEGFKVMNTSVEFSQEEILTELDNNPERFSPNVILRGIFQEKILPNVAFIGGGGELAYWLQYNELFRHYKVPLPMLVVRNSFLIADKKEFGKATKLGLQLSDFFLSEESLFSRFVSDQSSKQIKLNGSLEKVKELYGSLRSQATAVDQTLSRHVDALQTKAVDKLIELEKKMLRAEKKKFASQQNQLTNIRKKLFPSGKLQERHENVLYYLAMYGVSFIDVIVANSLAMEQEFSILVIE